jgi:ActR/RegA family two-component response regulator
MGTLASEVLVQSRIVIAIQDCRLRDRVALALERRGVLSQLFDGMDNLWAAPLEQLPSAAIVDCKNAVSVVRQLTDFSPALPILVLTGYATSNRLLSVFRLGNVRVRQKPLDADEMLGALGVPRPNVQDPEQTLVRRRALG